MSYNGAENLKSQLRHEYEESNNNEHIVYILIETLDDVIAQRSLAQSLQRTLICVHVLDNVHVLDSVHVLERRELRDQH